MSAQYHAKLTLDDGTVVERDSTPEQVSAVAEFIRSRFGDEALELAKRAVKLKLTKER